MKNILISQKIRQEGLDVFGEGYRILTPEGFTQEAFDALVPEADAIILRTNLRVTGAVIRSAPRLKVISRTGAGTDNIDLEAAAECGVAVRNLPALNNVAVAEHAVALMMAAAKSLPELEQGIRAGNWSAVRNQNRPVELRGKTLGVVGLGAIGSEMARISHLGLGMHILAYDMYAPAARFEGYARAESLLEVARRSDFITLHVPGSPATKGMIDEAFFSAVKPGAILINCARGSVVDETALLHALQSKRLAGAGLDVFDREPLPADHPLLSMPNVICTPHAGALTRETVVRAAVEACRQAKAVLEDNCMKKKGVIL